MLRFSVAVVLTWLNGVTLAFAQLALIEPANPREPLISVRTTPGTAGLTLNRKAGSLFIGQSGSSLLAPYPRRVFPSTTNSLSLGRAILPSTPQIVALRRLIADAEAGPLDYDAVQFGARIKPSKRPTQMTLQEIYTWIDQTPGQPHAIGRYQFIPPTLRSLASQLDLPPDTLFTPVIQDQLADILFDDAGLSQFTNNELSQREFMNNLAKIWAGLPNSTGRSHYHGYAGNKASISWAHFTEEMHKIFGT